MNKVHFNYLFLCLQLLYLSCGAKVEDIGSSKPLFGGLSESLQKLSDKNEEEAYLRTKEPAFDISGFYSLTLDSNIKSSSSSPDILLELTNEGIYGKMSARIERNDFSEKEKKIFSNLQIPLERVSKFKHEFTIDVGSHSSNENRENTSTDNGKIANIFFRSSPSEVFEYKNFNIGYTITGTIERNTNKVEGFFCLRVGHIEIEQGLSVLKEDIVCIPYNKSN